MQTKQLSFFLSLLLTLCLFHDTQAQQAGQIESMKLLAPNVGWAATKQKLFWTTDGGAQWKDITPKLNHKRQAVSSVFFLDFSTGWVLLHCGDGSDAAANAADDTCFELASTTNAGETWSVVHQKIVEPLSKDQLENGPFFSDQTSLDFVDAQHGWLILGINTSPISPSEGEMLRTADGGKTWSPVGGTPTSGHLHFVTAKDGWIAGGKEHSFFVTHDAGDSWQAVLLPKVPGTDPNFGVDYDLPIFEDQHHGFVSVRYDVDSLAIPTLITSVLFATDDGGRTWRQEKTFARVPDTYSLLAADSLLVVVRTEIIRPAAAGAAKGAAGAGPVFRTMLSFRSVGLGQPIPSEGTDISFAGAARGLSFLTPNEGWRTDLSDKLFATQDAGASWTDITPGTAKVSAPEAPRTQPPRSPPPQRGSQSSSPHLPKLEVPGASEAASTSLGFDTYNVPPVGEMSTWWVNSPFFDIGIYLQGSPNGHTDPILGSSNGPGWISSVQTQGQAWGLIPTWVGLQSPCACAKTNPTTGACTKAYASVFSSNPGQDGIKEAKAATAAASALGIVTPIIYKDIENYYGATLCTPAQQGAAGAAVQAFVSGWDSQLHLNGYSAGVYGNPKPAQNDFSKASTISDDVWIASYGPNNISAPRATIWGISGLCDPFSKPPCTLWSNHQRIRQYLGDKTVKYGDNNSISIDFDIVDALVAAPPSGTSSAPPPDNSTTYTVTEIAYPTSEYFQYGTFPYGINDEGTVVGWIWYGSCPPGCSCGNYPYACYLAFTLSNGTYSSFGVTGANDTQAYAINNLGTIVGCYGLPSVEYGPGCEHGFVLESGGTPQTLDYPGACYTIPTGINDAGQIAGYWYDANCSTTHGFVYSGGTFTSFDYPGATSTFVSGINGDGQIAGDFYPTSCCVTAFIYDAATGTFASFGSSGGTFTYQINNNGQVLALNGETNLLYDENNGNLTVLPASIPVSGPTGINDQGQIVGDTSGPSNCPGVQDCGFLATPQ